MLKKVVLKLGLQDDKDKKKAMKKVCGISGVESASLDPKEMKLTVTGDIDPVSIVSKLRKLCKTDIVSVGPAKEPEKKKEEPKKEEPKKAEAAAAEKKKEAAKDDVAELAKYRAFDPYPAPQHYYVRSVEEDPNACVIC